METIEKKDEKKHNFDLTQLILAVAASTILGIGATIFTLNGKMERMEEQITDLKEHTLVNQAPINSISNSIPSVTNVNPLKLESFIKDQQKQNVKTSYSDANCFKTTDLDLFKKNKKQNLIVADLMNNNAFIDLIISYRKLAPTERQTLLNRFSKIAKKTWDELGVISPEGQTVAGKEAELLISNAIVTKIEEMMSQSLDELKKYYK